MAQYFHIQILWLNSVYLRLLPYEGSEWTTNVLIFLCVCVSCHLVVVHGTATWKCDIPKVCVRYII